MDTDITYGKSGHFHPHNLIILLYRKDYITSKRYSIPVVE